MTDPKRFTTGRWRALAWFDDVERDRNLVMGRRTPSRWMVTKMIGAGQLMRVETNLRTVTKLILTEKGRADLESKWTRRANGFQRAKRSVERRRRNKLQAWQAGTGQGSGAPAK